MSQQQINLQQVNPGATPGYLRDNSGVLQVDSFATTLSNIGALPLTGGTMSGATVNFLAPTADFTGSVSCQGSLLANGLTSMNVLGAGGNQANLGVNNAFLNSLSFKGGSQGTITANGSTIATGTTPGCLAVDPTGSYLYCCNTGTNTISQYKIGSNGQLTALSTATVTSGNAPNWIVCHPTLPYVYVVNLTDNTVQTFAIQTKVNGSYPTQGALVSQGTIATGTSPWSLCIDPTGRYLYVTNSGTNTISQYYISQTTGLLTAMSPATVTITNGSAPLGIACDLSGIYLTVCCNLASFGGASFTIDQTNGSTAGQLTLLAGYDGLGTGVATSTIVSNPARNEWFYSRSTGAKIFAIAVGPNTSNPLATQNVVESSAALISTVYGGQMAMDPGGQFLYLASQTTSPTSDIQIIVPGANPGATPSSLAVVSTSAAPFGIAVSPNGNWLFASFPSTNVIQAYSIANLSMTGAAGVATLSGGLSNTKITITGGTQPALASSLTLTSTLDSAGAGGSGASFVVTSAGSQTVTAQEAIAVTLAAGYTGSHATYAGYFVNSVSGTGQNAAVCGLANAAGGTTAVGVIGTTSSSSTYNVGIWASTAAGALPTVTSALVASASAGYIIYCQNGTGKNFTINQYGVGLGTSDCASTDTLTSSGQVTVGNLVTTNTPPAEYGDGSDGNATISSNTTLTRDMYYNNLTVNSGVTVTMCNGGANGSTFRIFVKGLASVAGAIFDASYNVNYTNTYLYSSVLVGGNAGAGGTNAVGGAAPTISNAYYWGGIGGAGGSSGTNAGGAAASSTGLAIGCLRTPDFLYRQFFGSICGSWPQLAGGGGGGGGGGASSTGGTYGWGGNACVLAFNQISGAFTMRAKGANGTAGSGSNAGGGGGGGGGICFLLTATPSPSVTQTVTGGSGGAGVGTGSSGSAGGNGIAVTLYRT